MSRELLSILQMRHVKDRKRIIAYKFVIKSREFFYSSWPVIRLSGG